MFGLLNGQRPYQRANFPALVKMTKLHPARTMPFADLVEGLRAARAARLVYEQAGPNGLRLYCYSSSCVYDGQWNDATLIARGLVLDVEKQAVVATPFPKTADRLGWRMAVRHGYQSLSQLMAEANDLTRDAEGFVVRFDDGQRLKIKGAEYRRIHALVSRITPLAMWEIMQAGDDLATIRRDIPEEFWTDFDAICAILTRGVDAVVESAERAAASVAHLSDKEVGLRLNEFPADIRGLIFHPSQAEGQPVVRTVAPGDLSLDPADGQ